MTTCHNSLFISKDVNFQSFATFPGLLSRLGGETGLHSRCEAWKVSEPPTTGCPALPCVLALGRSPSHNTVADVPQPERWLYGCRAVARSKWIRVRTPSEGGLGVDRILFSYLLNVILCNNTLPWLVSRPLSVYDAVVFYWIKRWSLLKDLNNDL